MLVCVLFVAAGSLAAQTRGATLTKKQDPVYPEDASQKDKQGNVLFIGRIDKKRFSEIGKRRFSASKPPGRLCAENEAMGARWRSNAAASIFS